MSESANERRLDPLVLRLKEASGIAVANCETCGNLGSEDDGGDPPCQSWPVCHRFDRYCYLRSFPFKKEMNCWTPHFWHSKFAGKINGEKTHDDAVFAEWNKAIEEAENIAVSGGGGANVH